MWLKQALVFVFILLSTGCSLTRPVAELFWPQECPAPQVVEKIVVKEVPAELPPMAMTAGKMHFPIVGAIEWVRVQPSGLKLEARIDTGADTTSIHADHIQLLEKDGKRYVRFTLTDPYTGQSVELERRLRRKVLIKQTSGPSERRFVVKLWVTMGETKELIEVTLSDRSDFEYPLLLGRNFLTDTVIVDVSRHHTLSRQ